MNAAPTPGPWIAERDPISNYHTVKTAPRSMGSAAGVASIVIAENIARPADAAVLAAAQDLYAACQAALGLAWEVGCETEDGINTLLDDSRGDLYRQLSAALAKAVP